MAETSRQLTKERKPIQNPRLWSLSSPFSFCFLLIPECKAKITTMKAFLYDALNWTGELDFSFCWPRSTQNTSSFERSERQWRQWSKTSIHPLSLSLTCVLGWVFKFKKLALALRTKVIIIGDNVLNMLVNIDCHGSANDILLQIQWKNHSKIIELQFGMQWQKYLKLFTTREITPHWTMTFLYSLVSHLYQSPVAILSLHLVWMFHLQQRQKDREREREEKRENSSNFIPQSRRGEVYSSGFITHHFLFIIALQSCKFDCVFPGSIYSTYYWLFHDISFQQRTVRSP